VLINCPTFLILNVRHKLKKMTEKDNYIKDLYEDLKYSVSKFDSQVLAISSGAIGLSLTFIKDIVPFKHAIYSWIFYLSLAIFILCLTIGFIGHYLSIRQISDSIEKVSKNKITEIKQEKWIPRLNFGIVILLPIGVLLIVLYSIINIENYKSSEHKIESKKETKEIIKPKEKTPKLEFKQAE